MLSLYRYRGSGVVGVRLPSSRDLVVLASNQGLIDEQLSPDWHVG
jgi:hypothetical protein